MILTLTRGNSGCGIGLRLPAEPTDIAAVYQKLDAVSTADRQTRILRADTGIGALDRWLRDRPMNRPDDYTELGELSEKIVNMDDKALKTFDGALTGAAFERVADVLQIADSLDDYIFIHGVTTEKELGRFLVDTGYKGFPESVKPYLDYEAIGVEYCAERGGAFTADGYTLRRSSAEPLLTEKERPAVFRVHLQTGGMRNLGQDPFILTLPASDSQLQYAKNVLNIEDFEEAAIVKVECKPEYLKELIPLDDPDVVLLDELAESLTQARDGAEASKLTAALAAEKPATLEEAADIAAHLENYEMVQCTCEEYGRKALLELTGDQEVLDTIDGFIDWGGFGKSMMEADGITLTEYGMIRRVETPTPEQAMEMTQSPFL